MIHKTIKLKDHFNNINSEATLTSYVIENSNEYSKNRKRKTIIVLPGGGYGFLSDREAEPVALRFAGYDINAFVLRYSVHPLNYPYPLIEVIASLAYLYRNSEEYNIDVNSISIIGFSAGGHLAASAGVYYKNKDLLNLLNIKEEEINIAGLILSYPVISMYEDTHGGSRNALTHNDPQLMEMFSVEKHITKDFPKTFIWTTVFDTIVPSVNTTMLINELAKNKITFESHIYPMCDHGLSLADESVFSDDVDKEYIKEAEPIKEWVDLAIKFIKKYC